MDEKEMKLREEQVAKAVTRSFEQLIHDLENAPSLIPECETQPLNEENTLKEIRSWLFVRGPEDGYTDNSTDK